MTLDRFLELLADAVTYPETRWKIRVEWKPQDLWVGVFWTTRRWWGGFHDAYFDLDSDVPITAEQRALQHRAFDLWVCLLPMVPIHVERRWCPRPVECTSLSCWARDENGIVEARKAYPETHR